MLSEHKTNKSNPIQGPQQAVLASSISEKNTENESTQDKCTLALVKDILHILALKPESHF